LLGSDSLERQLCDRLDAIGPAPRAVLLHVLMLPDHQRAPRIGEFFGDPRTQTFAQLLIDLEESPHARAVVLGELRERELRGEP
jgi:non-ribosomal peptide synthetase component F